MLSPYEQELRDLIVSMSPPHGGAGMAGNATATVITAQSVFVNVAGTRVPSGFPHLITEATTGRLTYTGRSPRHFHIVANMDMLCDSGNQVLAFQWFRNGTAIGVPVKRKIGVGTDIGAASIHADAVLSKDDYLELRVANDTGTANVTVQNLYVFAMGMLM